MPSFSRAPLLAFIEPGHYSRKILSGSNSEPPGKPIALFLAG
jgi:hypothetical protein